MIMPAFLLVLLDNYGGWRIISRMKLTSLSRRWIALMVVLAGCHSWTQLAGGPGVTMAETDQKPVRITTDDGRTFILNGARVVRDSLIGIDGRGSRIAIPVVQVGNAEVRRLDAGKVFELTVGAIGVTAVVLYFVATRMLVIRE